METELLSDGTVVISGNTSFLHYPKLETSYEMFCKLNYHKEKKQLP